MKTSDIFSIFVNIWMAALVISPGVPQGCVCFVMLAANVVVMVKCSNKELKEENSTISPHV